MIKKTDVGVASVSLYKTTQERYLTYALSVITSRALPDVRDGLKPVQRRILYGMHEMHLSHESKFQKSAQVVGQVMGRYHPHGDSAIYDAMVRLAQDFSLRYPLVDGQGNFGSLDGDTAAAMRYTEARLQAISAFMLQDLHPEVVDFRPNYSGTFYEPTVLPTAVPALLANGSMGIAVGMATNIPPHHLGEVIDGCLAMIEKPEISLGEMMTHIPGPDFPTGGRILTSAKEIEKIYEVGRGAIDVQGNYHIEEDGRRKHIVITQIPYTVNKAQLVEKIASFISSNKLPLLTDVRDESTDEVRVVLDLRANADSEAVMAYLFKHSPLQSRFNVNLTCLVPSASGNCRPERLGLLAMLRYFLDFRFEVITKRLNYQLALLRERIHILEGFEKLFDRLDEAIAIIRESEDKPSAAKGLMAAFELDEIQAEAILQMRLYRLARLESDKIIAELMSKRKEAIHIERILSSSDRLWQVVADELKHLKERHSDERRSAFDGRDLTEAYVPENYIIEEDNYVIITRSNFFKRQKSFSDLASTRVKEDDAVSFVLFGSTRSPLILFSSLGKAYTTLVDNVPATTGHGSPLATVFNFEDGESIIGAVIYEERNLPPMPKADKTLLDLVKPSNELPPETLYIVSASENAQLVRLPLEVYTTISSATGRYFMRLNEGDTVMGVKISRNEGYISLIANNTRANVFPLADLPSLKTAGKGYRGIGLDADTKLIAFGIYAKADEGVRVMLTGEREMEITFKRFSDGRRGSKGRLILRRGRVEAILGDEIDSSSGAQLQIPPKS